MTLLLKILVSLGGLCYLILLDRITIGLVKLRNIPASTTDTTPPVSIVISARNEEENISSTLTGLLNQNYPCDLFEIIVIDDRSDDKTAEIVSKFSELDPRVKLIRQTVVVPDMSPKKQALEKGIQAAGGEIILTTDADCSHDSDWIREMISLMTPDVGMVVGQVRLMPPPSSPPAERRGSVRNYSPPAEGGRYTFWQRLQALDIQALGYASAGLVSSGMPFHCTGASFAYRKSLFEEISGWEGYEELVSGDDELLLAKASQTDWKITAATSPATIVGTKPIDSIGNLWQQRVRWGSKGIYYRTSRKLILAGVFLFFLMLTTGPFIAINNSVVSWLLIWVLIRFLLDWTALTFGSSVFKEKLNLLEFLILEIIYPPLIVLFATAGHLSTYKWKGQRFRSKGSG